MRNIILLPCLFFGLILQLSYGQNAPIATIGEVTTYNTTVEVPITVTDFISINGCDLKLTYDPSIATATEVTWNSALGTWFIPAFPEPGVITIAWANYSSSVTLAPNSEFATITFEKVAIGFSGIEFDTSNPSDCDWYTYPPAVLLNDSPTDTYYNNGSVNFNGFQLGLKFYLEGPFVNEEMTTTLKDLNLIPNSQPYSYSPWFYNGSETVPSIPADVVDWVLVELRESTGDASTATPDKTIAKQAGFLLKDGFVKDIDGINNLEFSVSISDNLYIVIYHRNHIAAISANPILVLNGIGNYNFSTEESKALGGSMGHKELSTGIWGLATGDSNADGNVDELDKQNEWDQYAGTMGYLQADFSMDSQNDNIDKNEFWLLNFDFMTRVP